MQSVLVTVRTHGRRVDAAPSTARAATSDPRPALHPALAAASSSLKLMAAQVELQPQDQPTPCHFTQLANTPQPQGDGMPARRRELFLQVLAAQVQLG